MSHRPAASARSALTIAAGKGARLAARLRGGGRGGTALPGLVIEKLDPGFLARTLGQLPGGVVVVSGTNGKTTTTKMVVQLLQSQGLRVLTNKTGSNFVRGVLASLLTEVSWNGKLKADIAVLELDEAHAVRFIQLVKPRACLLLNVMRDQLDRFGEIDYTASLLQQVAQASSSVVVLNADDPRLAAAQFAEGIKARLATFAIGDDLRQLFLSDDDLREGPGSGAGVAAAHLPQPTVRLDSLHGNTARIHLAASAKQIQAGKAAGSDHEVSFTIPGIHNQLNACAALALVLEILGPRTQREALVAELERIQPAFGRGEVIQLEGHPVELSLVKNPAGFRMGLLTAAGATAAHGPECVMIAINDEYADGRDMSWLWDVDFSALKSSGVAIVSGVRAWDMALRLTYDGIEPREILPDLGQALARLRQLGQDPAAPKHMRIFTTYTAMLEIRKQLATMTQVEEVMR